MGSPIPIPKIPKFHKRPEPLKASELNLMVDAINALAARIDRPGPVKPESKEFQFPFYPRYRYDAETGNGYASVTSGKLMEWGIYSNTGFTIHDVANTWQPPDDPIELQIYTGNQVSLKFEIIEGIVTANTAEIVITDEDATGSSGDIIVKMAVLRERPDIPNGASSEEWAAFDYYAAGSHVYFGGIFTAQNFVTNVCVNNASVSKTFVIKPD